MMTKIKSNVRGDSGLSDSQLVKSQKFFLEKHKDSFDELERCGKLEMDRRRFEKGVKNKKNGFWKRLGSLLGF
jgi:hypothetical protein